jgi:hypothetical protein
MPHASMPDASARRVGAGDEHVELYETSAAPGASRWDWPAAVPAKRRGRRRIT